MVVGSAETTVLAFQVSGQLQKLEVSEGDEITSGQQIAQLDQRSFENAVTAARAEYEQARDNFNRARELIQRGNIARSVYDQRRAAADIARAKLDSAEKDLKDSTLFAPFDGIIADLHVESFETVSASQRIMTVQGANAVEAVVQMPASIVINADLIQPLDLFVVLDAAPETRLVAALSETTALADAQTQTFETKFSFASPEGLLILPGMTGLIYGRYTLSGEAAPTESIRVPLSAVLSEAGQTYVWVVNPETMTVSRRDVVLGQPEGPSLTVEAGLAAGDLIIEAGGAYLVEGAKVRRYEP
ncbi:MAG: efflux RND transporter periplasmic adaptor subunit [Alphaproteobacteria bacterium]